MSLTYLILNLSFIVAVIVLLRVKLKRPSRAWWITLASLIVMTAIFDSIIVGIGLVDYDQAKILGILIGWAPIEDFFYAILACIIVPVIWSRLSLRPKGKKL